MLSLLSQWKQFGFILLSVFIGSNLTAIDKSPKLQSIYYQADIFNSQKCFTSSSISWLLLVLLYYNN